MAETRMLTVIAYDIVADRVRAKVADVLEARMARVQDSVFEARLTHREADRLFDAAARLIRPGDKLRLYAVALAGRSRCRAFGGAPLPEETSYVLL